MSKACLWLAYSTYLHSEDPRKDPRKRLRRVPRKGSKKGSMKGPKTVSSKLLLTT